MAEKKKEKKKTAAERIRSFLTIFNPGATAIERKVTPGVQTATEIAKKRMKK